jgi:hypothetical protein
MFQNEWLNGDHLPTLQFKVIVDGNAYTIGGDLCATCGCPNPYNCENKKPFNGIIMKMTFQKSLIYGVFSQLKQKKMLLPMCYTSPHFHGYLEGKMHA